MEMVDVCVPVAGVRGHHQSWQGGSVRGRALEGVWEWEGGGVIIDLAWLHAQEQQKGEGKELSPGAGFQKRGDGREDVGS
jgi:hypothetical protein